MDLDNDLRDLWLLAGMVGGLDEAASKRLIEEVQDARDGLPDQMAEARKDLVDALREGIKATLDDILEDAE